MLLSLMRMARVATTPLLYIQYNASRAAFHEVKLYQDVTKANRRGGDAGL